MARGSLACASLAAPGVVLQLAGWAGLAPGWVAGWLGWTDALLGDWALDGLVGCWLPLGRRVVWPGWVGLCAVPSIADPGLSVVAWVGWLVAGWLGWLVGWGGDWLAGWWLVGLVVSGPRPGEQRRVVAITQWGR